MKRIVHPPRTLEDVGFFTPHGEVELDAEDEEFIEVQDHSTDSDGQVSTGELRSLTPESDGKSEVTEEIPKHKERTSTYYELLKKRLEKSEDVGKDYQPDLKKHRFE